MAKEEMVEVEVNFTDDEFMRLALMAHKQDITFNQLCVNILEEVMKDPEKVEAIAKEVKNGS